METVLSTVEEEDNALLCVLCLFEKVEGGFSSTVLEEIASFPFELEPNFELEFNFEETWVVGKKKSSLLRVKSLWERFTL